MRRSRKVAVTFAALGIVSAGFAFGLREPAAMTEHRLVAIGPGTVEKPISLSVGDVAEFSPFAFAATPEFLKCKLSVVLEGDQALQEIGQIPAPMPGVGVTSRSVFLAAKRAGKTTISIRLVGQDGAEQPTFKTNYVVQVKGERPEVQAMRQQP